MQIGSYRAMSEKDYEASQAEGSDDKFIVIMSYSKVQALLAAMGPARENWRNRRATYAAHVSKLKALTSVGQAAANTTVDLDGTGSDTLTSSLKTVFGLVGLCFDYTDDVFDIILPVVHEFLKFMASEQFWRLLGGKGDLNALLLVQLATGGGIMSAVETAP